MVLFTLALAWTTQANAGDFIYNEITGKCVNSDGVQGYNTDIGVCADLSGQKIEKMDLSGRDLRGSKFYNAILTSVNFSGANLRDTDFRQADGWSVSFRNVVDATNARFDNSRLDHNDFTMGNFEHASFRNANLRNADFMGARLSFADFSFSELHGANIFVNSSDIFGTYWFRAEYDSWTWLPFTEQHAHFEGMIKTGW